MNIFQKTFKRLQQEDRKALVGFITAGDPNFEQSLDIVLAMVEAGVDILELGVPFSDPTADGPVIQRSSLRSLTNGMSLEKTLALVRKIREAGQTELPIVLFSYYNPILAYGREAFYKDAVASGANGVLVVDLPAEESGELTATWDTEELAPIQLVAPTTRDERFPTILAKAKGFVYLISRTGVTGKSGTLDVAAIERRVEQVRAHTELPICTGFGIATPEEAKMLKDFGDGVVVGSAFERIVEDNLEAKDLSKKVAELVAAIGGAL